MNSYTREKIKVSDILLDVENPRFASYFERLGKSQPTQDDIMLYMLQNESVSTLAANIREIGGLHPAESIVCIKQGDEYIVLEGNRRVSACKALCKVYSGSSVSWIPRDVVPSFPLLNFNADKALIDNVSLLEAVIYETREQAQPYISDKHIDGVKKWESIEKSSYFYRMFWDRLKTNNVENLNADAVLTEIVKITGSKRGDVKECITKYSFFMSVYNTLLSKYQPENLTETSSYLPLVDRFMGTIVEESDLGLNLPMSDEFRYVAHKEMDDLLNAVLFLTGEAFIARKTSGSELSPIISTEVSTKPKQKKLIRDNERIPGLLDALSNYRVALTEETNQENDTGKSLSDSDEADSSDKARADDNTSNDEQADTSEQLDETPFEPEIPWKPKQPQSRTLYFSENDGKSFSLSDDDETDVKIKFIIAELSRLPINKFPYSCTSLYRLLLEAVTKKAYIEKQPKENKNILSFDKKNLQAMVSKLAKNNVLIMSEADRANVREYVDKKHIIGTLNEYMHNPKLVDSEIILTSWITLREYIKACLAK